MSGRGDAENCAAAGRPARDKKKLRTLERRETTVENQLQVAKLPLRQDNGGQTLGLVGQLLSAGSIAGNEVLEDAAW